MVTSLTYIHIGNDIPDYLYDSVYQSLLVSPNSKIYVILDDENIAKFTGKVSNFNLNIYTKNVLYFELNIQCIPLSILSLPDDYTRLIKGLSPELKDFRSSFWIYTIARFFYIHSFMHLFKLSNTFHIENDIMLYEDLDSIVVDKNLTYMVRDSPDRVIASFMYLNAQELEKILGFMIEKLSVDNNLNDMQLLGSYISENVRYMPIDFNTLSGYIYDASAIGQYLGGIDPRNIPGILPGEKRFQNPTKGFINETCTFNPTTVKYFTKPITLDNITVPVNLLFCAKEDKDTIDLKQVVNLHVHSKELFQFSCVSDITFKDIITGDRVLSLCDIVITNDEIFGFHKNIESFIDVDKIVIVKKFATANIDILNKYFQDVGKKIVNLFVYTHIFDDFIKYILPYMDKTLQYVLYLHNSDHALEQKHYNTLLNTRHIRKVFAQNINCTFTPKKFQLLPIGLANSMWPHGDKLSLYSQMSDSYFLNKTKGIYININPNTYAYRQVVLDELTKRPTDFDIIGSPKPYKEYLQELSEYRFCLCLRGNGNSTHREFESLYLGVIPVIVNNKHTNMEHHVQYFRDLHLPFLEITDETLDKYNKDFFSEELYKQILKNHGSSILNSPALKMSYYQ